MPSHLAYPQRTFASRLLTAVLIAAFVGFNGLETSRLAAETVAPSTASPGDDTRATDAARSADPSATDFFENEIRPLLHNRCGKCHNDSKRESGLSLVSRDSALRGGESGPAIVPGRPDDSRLLSAVRHEGGIEMPPDGKLAQREIDALARWISSGAAWIDLPTTTTRIAGPRVRSGPPTEAERLHWSFQPIQDSPVPNVTSTWIRNDIDRFVLDRLQQAGLQPQSAADRRTWLRRATFDLTGLPPTHEEVEVYLHDESHDATARVIERLLGSNAYGERWGRHWLDVVRYADTAGETGDYPTPQAYKYRNWVIAAFNRDLPYDEFVRQQIAGDLIGAERVAVEQTEESLQQRREMLIATGFIAISRRFGFDVENYHHLTIQDTIDTLGQAVLGLSLGCARCHDHKFDPLSSADFYSWFGIFASTRYSFPGSEEKKRPYDLFAVTMSDSTIEVRGTDQAGREDGIYGAIEGTQCANAKLQLRGDPAKLGDEVPRRNLAILGGQAIQAAGSGRADLANWLTRTDNPLTARVIANRIWQQHFGRGIVSTENDFGARGQLPTHPELLDWLASRLIESGWSLKSLHRLIMNSATYQQASTFDATAAEADVDNRLMWRFSRRRLSAEEIRDAMLAVSGRLDRSQPAGHPFPALETWGFTQHAPFYAEYPSLHRSVYLMQQRLKRHPFLALFDGADPNSTTAHRELTTVPTQSLFLMNSTFVDECAQQLADACCLSLRERESAHVDLGTQAIANVRVVSASADAHAQGDPADVHAADDKTGDGIDSLCQRILARAPLPQERADAAEFLDAYKRELAVVDTDASPDDRDHQAWAALARTLLIRNEFLFVD